jgi:hypothetical protein
MGFTLLGMPPPSSGGAAVAQVRGSVGGRFQGLRVLGCKERDLGFNVSACSTLAGGGAVAQVHGA